MYYTNLFFINSIVGFILEMLFFIIFKWKGNSGIFYGPWTPIYGIGSIIIVITYKYFNNKSTNKLIKNILFLLTVAIILSIIEYIGGILIENIFNEVFWNYSNHKFNFGKYASLEMSLIWAIASLIYIYIIHPFINKFVFLIPKTLTYIFTLLFIIDIITTIIIKL